MKRIFVFLVVVCYAHYTHLPTSVSAGEHFIYSVCSATKPRLGVQQNWYSKRLDATRIYNYYYYYSMHVWPFNFSRSNGKSSARGLWQSTKINSLKKTKTQRSYESESILLRAIYWRYFQHNCTIALHKHYIKIQTAQRCHNV